MQSEGLENEKIRAARVATQLVPEDATVALGSGSTAHHAIKALAARFPGGGGLRCVASSRRSEEIAKRFSLQIVPLEEVERFDLMLDGADEVAPNLTLIKGGGGAHFREKLLARMSDKLIVMVDHTKLVRKLGMRSPLPVEVVPFSVPYVARELSRRALMPTLRMSASTSLEGEPLPFVTDNGNHVLDCRVPSEILDEKSWDLQLRATPGVVETGLFVNMAHLVLVGMPDGRVEELRPKDAAHRPSSVSFLEEALTERAKAPAAPSPPKRKEKGPRLPRLGRRKRAAAAVPAQ
ncbi:MAG: ribose-5-phosphate isomerase RpiA [Euryarchaeota archaeon]|nr:ribose-5-phosphate isomerase RpiA [Euryarchaeota archaeon]MDE1836820.1 ribose-5-phosphate isomerase RpiA [Euryarchaeota archaeon]MDE1881723.1 ribose-5-phosphate isomerase RpiA [Euryarchaeota archaeon]MDE2044804.1 ribose-5-phosphate isomerase RpiA [Thermoplasmata archaeon]